MKKKISKIKLFKSEKERFWFKKMSDEEIRKKIEQYNEI
jgi:ribosomal protein S21